MASLTDDNEADGNLDKRNMWLIGVGHTSLILSFRTDIPAMHSPCRSALAVLLLAVFHASFPVEFFLAEYEYLRGTGHGWPVQPDAAWMPLEGGPQHGDAFTILLRKIHRNKCMENGKKQNRQSTPAGASSMDISLPRQTI